MKRYPAHPLALIVPPMTPDEFRDLKADIKANGLEQPITLYEEKILDGIHRERACFELGLTVETREWRKRNGGSPIQYVLSMNGHRRQLSPGQRASLALALADEMRKRFPAQRIQGGGSSADGDPQAIARELGIQADEDYNVVDVVSKAIGVGTTTVANVAALRTEAPRLFGKVRDGLISVAEATRERKAEQPKPRRTADEINASLIADLISNLRRAADAAAKLEMRDFELAGHDLLSVWGYGFTVAATIKSIAKNPKLPETKAGAQRLLGRIND